MRFLVLIFILISCAQPPKPVTPPPPQFIEHTVKYQGETLAAISGWYLGDIKRWKEIQAVNPGLKPERIKIGDKIKIPADKAVKRDPFPKPKVSRKAPAPKDEVKPDEAQPEDKAGEATEENTEGKPSEEPKAEQVEQNSEVAPEAGNEPAPVTEEDREKLREKTRLELLQDVLNQNP